MGDLLLFTGQIQQREEKQKDDSNGKAPPPPPPHQKCPRCWSTNTKFCYYNNYSISQPRYFCKDCKRYWTLGGSLRDIPLGGYVRKDKRSKKATGTPDDNNTQETRPQQPIILETRTAAMPASMPAASARNIETSMLSNPGFLPTGPASSFYIPSATIRAPFYQPIPVGSQALFMDNQDQVIGMQQTEVQPSNNMPPPCQRLYQSSVISSLNPASSFPKASGFGLPPL